MLSLRSNLMANNATRHLGIVYKNLATSVERLASGLRINSASDDPAGMAVSEMLSADIVALEQGYRNANDAISMLQTAEGALSIIDDDLTRMRELAEEAASGSYSEEQIAIMQEEFDEIAEEITRISNSTEFNGIYMLNETTPDAVEISLGSGLTSGLTIKIDKHDMQAVSLGVGGLKGVRSGLAVGAADEIYMTGATSDQISFAFTIDGTTKTLTIDVEADMTLEEVVSALNSESRGEIADWNVASVNENTETGQFVLKLEGWEAGPITSFTINSDADGDGNDVDWGSDTPMPNTPVTNTHFESVAGCDALTLGTQAAIDAVDDAIVESDAYRGHVGYMITRLESAADVLDVQAENLTSAKSRITDVDYALETAEMTRLQVLAQAGIAVLAETSTFQSMALTLLS